jgi:hypothetical protein
MTGINRLKLRMPCDLSPDSQGLAVPGSTSWHRWLSHKDGALRPGMRVRRAARSRGASRALDGRHAAAGNRVLVRRSTDELGAGRERARRAGGDRACVWHGPLGLGHELNPRMGCPRERVGAAPADDGAGHNESNDDEDRAGDETRPPAGKPDQERPGKHVADQPRTRDLTLRPQLVFKIEKPLAVAIPNPSRIELEQRARHTRAHAGWTPIRARPTRVICSSRRSWLVSAAVPAAVI